MTDSPPCIVHYSEGHFRQVFEGLRALDGVKVRHNLKLLNSFSVKLPEGRIYSTVDKITDISGVTGVEDATEDTLW